MFERAHKPGIDGRIAKVMMEVGIWPLRCPRYPEASEVSEGQPLDHRKVEVGQPHRQMVRDEHQQRLAGDAEEVGVRTVSYTHLYVLYKRLPLVREASQEFENHHSKATGVVADTVTNLMAVRTAAAEPRERFRVEDLMQQSVNADLRARSIFMRTQLQLETSIVVGTLLALIAGTTMAVHHWSSTAALYLILYYSAQVALSLQQSFEHLRSLARSLGRAAKFTAIAGEEIEITNCPNARDVRVSTGRVEFNRVSFGYRSNYKLFQDLTLAVKPGEHVALVGPSGSGKSTLSKLLLRFMDVDAGQILVDGQDIREVTLASLRSHVSYVPQDPQLLHRTCLLYTSRCV